MGRRIVLAALSALTLAAILTSCATEGSMTAGTSSPSRPPPGGGSLSPQGHPPASAPASGATPNPAAERCVAQINAYRRTLGLAPLSRWTQNEACTNAQSARDGQGHDAHGHFGECGEMAQNTCPGWPGPPERMIDGCLQMMWNEGPGGGHHDSMASRRYTMVACGFAMGPNGEVWANQNFR